MPDRPFSVLISVYKGDNPEYFRTALESILDQTAVPSEVTVVADGPLTDKLDGVIDEFQMEYPSVFNRISLSENYGLGKALHMGVESCSHKLVARMDADDVADRDRFKCQLEYFKSNPEVDVLGGYVSEFKRTPERVDQVRKVPHEADEVREFAKFRCPTNHPSVMFRRDSVLEAGNYRPWRSMQDYELWVRMLTKGYVIENIPKVLVNCRAGNDLYSRRGGLDYVRLELKLQREFLRMGATSKSKCVYNLLCRIPIRVFPNRFRKWIYKHRLRF